MKKDYNSKKKATIGVLSLVAICLAVGLFYLMGTKGNEPPHPVESKPPVETEVIVPEIKPESVPTAEIPTVNESRPATNNQPTETVPPTSGDVARKPSEGKPKSPTEATPPTEKPKETDKQAPVENPDESGNCQPEQKPQPEQNQPQGGDTRSDGAIYVPGFGWVEDSGEENGTVVAPNAGTGEQVGDM